MKKSILKISCTIAITFLLLLLIATTFSNAKIIFAIYCNRFFIAI